MTESSQAELWTQFNLAAHNPDPGGGILYALRYDSDKLFAMRDSVVGAMTDNNATISEQEDGLAIGWPDVSETGINRLLALTEELSVVNEALWRADEGVKPATIEEFSEQLKRTFLQKMFGEGKPDLVELFIFVEYAIPQIVSDIMLAHCQNEVLSKKQQDSIASLGSFAAGKSNELNESHIVIIG